MKMIEWVIIISMIIVCISCRGKTGDKKEVDIQMDKNEIPERELSYDEYIDALKKMGAILPIKGAYITKNVNLLPDAPRNYRCGSHEGFDFYNGFCGVKIENGTPILAIANGEIIRADTNYIDIEPEKREALLKEVRNLGFTPDSTLDVLRGRQVWISHGNGIVTRYCHLSRISKGLKGKVTKGDIIGFVGGSGTKSKTPHLHFEIRLGKDFLGKGKPPKEIRDLVKEILRK